METSTQASCGSLHQTPNLEIQNPCFFSWVGGGGNFEGFKFFSMLGNREEYFNLDFKLHLQDSPRELLPSERPDSASERDEDFLRLRALGLESGSFGGLHLVFLKQNRWPYLEVHG